MTDNSMVTALPRSDILGRLLLIPSMLEVLPGTGAIAIFLDRALREIPGVDSLTLSVDGKLYPPKIADNRVPVAASHNDDLGGLSCHPVETFPRTTQGQGSRKATILLATPRHQYGYLIFRLNDPDKFALYEPYLHNIANIVATMMENRDFKHHLETTNERLTQVLDHLEQRVQERTQDLHTEIEHRKALEADLRASRAKYRKLLTTTSEGFYMVDADLHINDANQAFCDMLGYTRQELIGLSPLALVADEGQTLMTEQLAKIPSTQHRHYEIAFQSKQGHKRYTSIHATTLQSTEGGLEGAFAFVTDITERKRAEEKLQLAATVFAHAREGIFITDAAGTILEANAAFTRITGYTHREAVGQNPRILKSGRQKQGFYEAMWRSLIDKGEWTGEIWNRRKTGEVYAAMLTISVVHNSKHQPQYYVALCSNITAQKENQKQLEHIAHYDALTDLPNRMLLEDRLHQAMAQADRSGQPMAVVYLVLDGFKAINDTYGHEAGDHLLITVATRMQQTLREGDTIARLGGDEFVAILQDCGDTEASVESFVHRLLAAASQPVDFHQWSLQVSASVGVTFYPQHYHVNGEQLLCQADEAMYGAKQAGKNGYCFFKR
jgi:diguanylate cyclase (GGDEF)-like protein/PAS domain S-box-containing protein